MQVFYVLKKTKLEKKYIGLEKSNVGFKLGGANAQRRLFIIALDYAKKHYYYYYILHHLTNNIICIRANNNNNDNNNDRGIIIKLKNYHQGPSLMLFLHCAVKVGLI